MNSRSEKIRSILVPVLSVIMGFLSGTIIMAIFGYDLVARYQAMSEVAFQGKKSISEIFVTTAPLIFTALGFPVANPAGLFNIGLSGQTLCGWVASIWVILSIPDAPRMTAPPVAIIVGVAAGVLAAAIPGFLHVCSGTNGVAVMIMLNYTLLYTGNHTANNVMKPSIMANKRITEMIGANASLYLPFLASINDDSRLNIGVFLAFIFLILVWFLMKKAALGFEVRSAGLDPFTSEYAGISSKRAIILSIMISRTLAGLGGTVQGLGTFQSFFIQNASLSIGFDGMAVLLLGAGSSVGILLSALLFGMLKLGGQGMPLIVGVPAELVDVVIATVTFFVGTSYLVRFLLVKASGNKKKVVTAETIEVAPDKNNQEEGDI